MKISHDTNPVLFPLAKNSYIVSIVRRGKQHISILVRELRLSLRLEI